MTPIVVPWNPGCVCTEVSYPIKEASMSLMTHGGNLDVFSDVQACSHSGHKQFPTPFPFLTPPQLDPRSPEWLLMGSLMPVSLL